MDNMGTIVTIGIVILVVITIIKTARIVPQKSAFIVERLGKYAKTLEAGFHILVPFMFPHRVASPGTILPWKLTAFYICR